MGKPSGPDNREAEFASTVDRLLKKLPFADPYPSRQPKTSDNSGPSKRITGPIAGVARSVAGAPPPTTQERLGTWARVVLGGIVAAAMLQWPYAHDCDLRLGAYLMGVTVSLLAGGWGAVSSWNRRMAIAHVASIGIVMWGLGLGAAQVLPRTGYAKAEATWRCVDTAAAAATGSTGVLESAGGAGAADLVGVADSAGVADSVGVDSAGVATDSVGAAGVADSAGASAGS